MKKFILLSFMLLISMGLWAQILQGQSEEVTVKPPQFAGQPVAAVIADAQSIQDYVAANMQYPERDIQYRNEGTEVICFTVGIDGTLSNFEVINSVSSEMDAEITRVLQETNGMWIAGTNNEGAVEMQTEVAVACKIAWDGTEKSVTNFKKVATNYFTRGSKLLYLKDHPRRALANFNEGIQYLPYDANLLVMRGYAKFALGDKEGAIEDWKTVKNQTGIDNLKAVASMYQDLDGYAELLAETER